MYALDDIKRSIEQLDHQETAAQSFHLAQSSA